MAQTLFLLLTTQIFPSRTPANEFSRFRTPTVSFACVISFMFPLSVTIFFLFQNLRLIILFAFVLTQPGLLSRICRIIVRFFMAICLTDSTTSGSLLRTPLRFRPPPDPHPSGTIDWDILTPSSFLFWLRKFWR